MFCDPFPLQLLSKNHFFSIFWNGVDLPPSYSGNVFQYTGGVFDVTPNILDLCKYCPNPPPADLHHCFFECIKTQNVSRSLVGALRHHDPFVTTEGLLRLELRADGVKEVPLVWVTAHTLNYLWKTRSSGKVADLILTRAMLESQINILRETRYHELVPQLKEILKNFI